MSLKFKTYPISEEIEHYNCTFFKSINRNAVKVIGQFTYLHNRGIFIDLMDPIDFEENMTLYAECEFGYYTFYDIRRRDPNGLSIKHFNTMFDADYLLYSRKFPTNDFFKKISFSLVNLSSWFPKVHYKTNKGKTTKTIKIPKTHSVTLNISDNTLITFKSNIREKNVFNKLEFDLSSSIVIENSTQKQFKEMLNFCYEYRTFFQLLSDSYCSFTDILIFDNMDENYRVRFADLNSEKSLQWDEHRSPFIDFQTMEKYLPSAIRNWDRLYKEIRQVIDILIMEFNN